MPEVQLVIGWMKVKDAAKYAGVSARTFRGWLKDGLKHSRLNTGTILIKAVSIDQYLEQFEVREDSAAEVDAIVKDVLNDMHQLNGRNPKSKEKNDRSRLRAL